jgi:hypothetical protein
LPLPLLSGANRRRKPNLNGLKFFVWWLDLHKTFL